MHDAGIVDVDPERQLLLVGQESQVRITQLMRQIPEFTKKEVIKTILSSFDNACRPSK